MGFKLAPLLLGAALAAGLAAGATAEVRVVDEIVVGAYEHDVPFLASQREHGADANLEVRFASPDFLKAIGSPRPFIGGLYNTEKTTNQGYFGLNWDFTLARALFRAADSLFLGADLGGAVADASENGKLKRKALGSHMFFREDLDLGYRFDPSWSVMASFNHISNAGLAKHNQGLNDLGLRIGYRF